MKDQHAVGGQEKIFKSLINEFKKAEPDSEQIEHFMKQLNLEYQSDEFANLDKVLQALSFEHKNYDFRES